MEFDPGAGMAWSPDGRYVACTSRTWGDLITVRLSRRQADDREASPGVSNLLPDQHHLARLEKARAGADGRHGFRLSLA
jgi:hypothetical protein